MPEINQIRPGSQGLFLLIILIKYIDSYHSISIQELSLDSGMRTSPSTEDTKMSKSQPLSQAFHSLVEDAACNTSTIP